MKEKIIKVYIKSDQEKKIESKGLTRQIKADSHSTNLKGLHIKP